MDEFSWACNNRTDRSSKALKIIKVSANTGSRIKIGNVKAVLNDFECRFFGRPGLGKAIGAERYLHAEALF